jgi:signal transduction histidine kinase
MEPVRSVITRTALAIAVSAIALALVLLPLVTVWWFVSDLNTLRYDLLRKEIHAMRSITERSAGHFEQLLESDPDAALGDVVLLQRLKPFLPHTDDGQAPRYAYAAVVGDDGVILSHTDPDRRGRQLGRDWYDRVLYPLGTDVRRTRSQALTGGLPAYDVYAQILVHGDKAGSYHLGLGQRWFDTWTAGARRDFLVRRSLGTGAVWLVAAAAAVSLYYLTRRVLVLRRAVTETYMRAASELGRLSAGLAHEIRNPLHALRLNLHAFQRTQQDRDALEPQEITRMLAESSTEIDRIDHLLRQLINFATPGEASSQTFNLNSELEGVVDFIGQELQRSNVQVHLSVPRYPVSVRMDSARLRQIMLNLLHNARDSMPEGGPIHVNLTRKNGQVEIAVADQGRGIAEADLPHIYEPFFTTSDDGTGMGLALVRRFVQEVGGDVRCEANQPRGTRFRIRLAEAASPRSSEEAPT